MQAIKMKVWEVNAFRMLFIFEFICFLIVGGCYFVTKRFFDIPTYIFGSLILLCVIGQLLLLVGKDYIAFSEKEIFVFFAKKEYRFSWEDILNPKFYSSDYRIFLCQNTMDFSIREKNKFVPFSEKFGGKQVSCTPEQYKQFYALYVAQCNATE